MHTALRHLDHRPWPLPAPRWTWRQNWYDLLFAHWPIDAAVLRPHIPAGLAIDEFDGSAWLGAVPFRMTGVMRRPLPDLPWLSAFPELNLRTYVTRNGRPGVWFLSLDTTNRLAVWAARRFFHLPYHHARIRFTPGPDRFHFHSDRRGLHFDAAWQPTSEPYLSKPGTLESFLTERYCLYAQSRRGHLYRAEVHHPPWPLRHAEGEVNATDLVKPFQLELPRVSPILHATRGVETVVWGPQRLL